jgi:hypothetical protein
MRKTYSIQDIKDRLFMIKDKMRLMEMFLAHARKDIYEIEEHLMDAEEKEFERQYSQL